MAFHSLMVADSAMNLAAASVCTFAATSANATDRLVSSGSLVSVKAFATVDPLNARVVRPEQPLESLRFDV